MSRRVLVEKKDMPCHRLNLDINPSIYVKNNIFLKKNRVFLEAYIALGSFWKK
jgi:hypothetical protein